MARVKIEEIFDELSHDMKRALEDPVKRVLPQATFDRNELFREFKREIGRKCNTWERVKDSSIEVKE